MSQVKELIQQAVKQLENSDSGLDSAVLDAQVLLAHSLGVDRTWVITWSDKELDEEQETEFRRLLNRRKQGEPIAYILGHREFWGRDFLCNEHTLIPRPDTERLVETVLGLNLSDQARVLDLGTGTGCIALTLAAERPNWQLVATDYSEETLKVAEKNKLVLGLGNVQFLKSDWYQSLSSDASFDLIVANPPYIDPASHYLHEGDVRFEPDMALTSESQGLDALQTLISSAPKHLKKGGWLVVEHGFDQAALVQQLFTDKGFQQIQLVQDLAGLDRCSFGCICF